MTKVLDKEIEPFLLEIIENNPTEWPFLFAGILGDTRLSDETRQNLAQVMDEICQYESVEELKLALTERKK
jgi:hypothetical protein